MRATCVSLERRLLLAVNAVASGGTLRIYGTDSADTVTVSYVDASRSVLRAVVNGEFADFASAGINLIRIAAGSGNDRVDFDHTNGVIKLRTVIYGGAGDDTLGGGKTRDRIYGEEGNDSILGSNGHDILYGGPGNDTILGGVGKDYLSGQEGDDVIQGNAEADRIWGDAGNDAISAGDGNDSVEGGLGIDTLDGGNGDDLLYGGEDPDVVTGGAGNDRIYGGSGADRLDGADGRDTVYGEAGNDTIDGGSGGGDYLLGGEGTDTVRDRDGFSKDRLFGEELTGDASDSLHQEGGTAPASIAGMTFRANIQSGTWPFADRGSFVFRPRSGGTYTITATSGSVANSSGTYQYTRSSATEAQVVFNDSLVGPGLSAQLTFTSSTSASYLLLSSLGGWQRGTFTLVT